MRFLLPLLLAFVVLAPSRPAAQQSASAAEASRYVGLRHDGRALPAGLKSVGGSLVSHPYEDAEQYGLAEIHRGRVKMLWFDYMTHRDSAGKPYWEVRDVLVLPRIPRGQLLCYANCYSGKKPDGEIVAFAEYTDTEFLTRVRRAWRASRKTGKFEVIPVKGIKCTNEGHGM